MAVIKLDTFTVAANTPLENHISDSGGGWQGNEVDHFDVIATADEAQPDGTGPSTVSIIGDEGPLETDYFAEVIGKTGGTATHGIGVVVRASGGAVHERQTHNSYSFYLRGADGWRLQRLNNGSVSLTQSDTGYVAANGITGSTVLGLRLEVRGQGVNTNLKCYIDPDGGGYQLVLDFTDSGGGAIDVAGNPGILFQGALCSATFFNAEDFVVPAAGKLSTLFRRRR